MVKHQIDFESLDSEFSQQVSKQLQKATAELNHLEQLLKAGMVDREALTDFRESVNRVRHTGWAVQQAMEAPGSKEDVQLILTMERVRAACQLNGQLAADLNLGRNNAGLDRNKLEELAKNIKLLAAALEAQLNHEPLEL